MPTKDAIVTENKRKVWSLVVTGLCLGFLAARFMGIHHTNLFRTETSRSSQIPKSPPFPKILRGVPVEWVPDDEIRSLASRIDPRSVESIIVANVRVEEPAHIAALITALNKSVRLKGDPFNEAGHGPLLAPQFMLIYFRSHTGVQSDPIQIICYPDLYQGKYSGMARGTFCPEFQDAMRAAGIPDQSLPLKRKPFPWMM